MKTLVLDWSEKEEAVEALKQGEVVLFPTETVYGIACLCSNEEAYERMKEAKSRPENKPFTLMCSDIASIVAYCQIDVGVAEAMKAFMPGEVTFLLKARAGIPHCIDLGTGVVGVRIPNSKEVIDLIERVGEPLLVSSANFSGEKAASDYMTALSYFDGRAYAIIKGDCVSLTPSTIVDMSKQGDIRLIRQGNVPFENIAKIYNNAAKTISLGSDHGGFEYKEAIKRHLEEMGYKTLDFGTNSTASCDYPIFGKAAARAVNEGKADFGIVVCTSGEGISIAANKVPAIRCGIGYDDVVTAKTREHNDANMIAFGQKYMNLSDVLRRVDIFLSVPFSSETKHHRRVDELEK